MSLTTAELRGRLFDIIADTYPEDEDPLADPQWSNITLEGPVSVEVFAVPDEQVDAGDGRRLEAADGVFVAEDNPADPDSPEAAAWLVATWFGAVGRKGRASRWNSVPFYRYRSNPLEYTLT